MEWQLAQSARNMLFSSGRVHGISTAKGDLKKAEVVQGDFATNDEDFYWNYRIPIICFYEAIAIRARIYIPRFILKECVFSDSANSAL